MNKLFVFLGVLGILGIFLMIGVSGVIAVDQGINASINTNTVLVIKPTTVEFGVVSPGTFNNPATTGNITFNATGSNMNITVEGTNVAGIPFEAGLKLNSISPVGVMVKLPCISLPICTYDIKKLTPTLDVPIGTPAGVRSGTITYLVTSIPPI